MSSRYEPFKLSPLSPCKSCEHIEDDCFHYNKVTSTDAKLGHSYVVRCSQYSKSGAINPSSSQQEFKVR